MNFFHENRCLNWTVQNLFSRLRTLTYKLVALEIKALQLAESTLFLGDGTCVHRGRTLLMTPAYALAGFIHSIFSTEIGKKVPL